MSRPAAHGDAALMKEEMKGSHNQSLRVNLSEHTWAREELSAEVLGRYLGGKGLAARLLVQNAAAGVDPLASESSLVVAAGPGRGSSPQSEAL